MTRKRAGNPGAEGGGQTENLSYGTAMGPRSERTPVGPNQSRAAGGGRHHRFEEGTPVRMRAVSPDDDVLYERLDGVQQAASDLAGLIGEYESRETGATLKVTAGEKPGELTLRVATTAPLPLRPTFREAFGTPLGSSIVFARTPAGKVISHRVGETGWGDNSSPCGRDGGGAQRGTGGSAAGSGAFSRVPDGWLTGAEAGAPAVIQPGGSVKDGDVIAAADEAGLAMVFTGMRHFRH